jgi:outer membrane protein
MRKIYLLTTLIFAATGISNAQESAQSTPAAQTQSFTLEQAIEYGLANAVSIKNAELDERIASARVKETRGIGLPQISGDVNVVHNEQLPRFFGYKQTLYGFAAPINPDTKQPIPYEQFLVGVPDKAVVAGQNFFQLKNSGSANFALTQILFNGSYLVGLKAANAYRDLSVRSTAQSRETVIQQVTKAFYAVLINKDRLNLFETNIERVESLLKTTAALNENGFAEAIDVDRIKVTLNNLKAEREKFYNLQELSTQLLKFQMNYPMEKELIALGEISTLKVDETVLTEYSAQWDYTRRSDYQLLNANQTLQELNLKNKYAEGLPSLAAFANYGWQTQSGTFSGVFKTETNLSEDNKVQAPALGLDKWYAVSNVGFSLSVPIFSGLQRTYKVQQAKLELLKIENNMSNLKSAIDLEVKQTAISYLNAITSLKSQEENRRLAENVARVTKIKYEQGVGSNIEVIEAESSLREAQINYYSALYDALVAKVDLDKAYGKLLPSTQEKK